jgi:predicted phage tail protein
VRIKPVMPAASMSVASTNGLICRLRIGAAVIECAQWPPTAWVAALASGPADAAA